MQETEIKNNLILSKLSVPGFDIELENNSRCSKAGIWYKVYEVIQIWREHYNRWHHWVKDNHGIINIYRSFSPLNGLYPRANFTAQLEIIAAAWIPGAVIVGDFKLNWDIHHVTMLLLKLTSMTWLFLNCKLFYFEINKLIN